MKAGIFVTAGALALASCNQGPPPVPIKDLMAEQVQPTAQVYWDAVRFVSDETGDHDIMPRTDAEWEKVRKSAEDLGKFGELLKTEAYTEGRAADWTQFAQGLVDVSKLAEQAAVEKNTDKVFEVGGTVYSVCSACHQVYPPAAEPGAATPAS
jgi:hypothetical protein